jgi:hypothetical protein
MNVAMTLMMGFFCGNLSVLRAFDGIVPQAPSQLQFAITFLFYCLSVSKDTVIPVQPGCKDAKELVCSCNGARKFCAVIAFFYTVILRETGSFRAYNQCFMGFFGLRI